MTCLISTCDRPRYGRKPHCSMHDQRLRHGWDMDKPPRNATPKPCSVAGCNKLGRTKTMCDPHYSQVKRNKKRQQIQAEKLRRGCVDCGYAEHAAALDFDHLPGAVKAFNLSQVNHSWADIEAEMAKCEVVCANCHRVRTQDRSKS